jgi:hypothetical protein
MSEVQSLFSLKISPDQMLKIGITPLVRAETVFKPKIENNNLIQPLNPTPKNNQSRRANPTRSVQQGFRDGKTSRKTIIRFSIL